MTYVLQGLGEPNPFVEAAWPSIEAKITEFVPRAIDMAIPMIERKIPKIIGTAIPLVQAQVTRKAKPYVVPALMVTAAFGALLGAAAIVTLKKAKSR